MTNPLTDLDALEAALAKATDVNGIFWHLPWRVVPESGKPYISGARSGCLFRGSIATWDEARLVVLAVNALPALLSELRSLREPYEAGRQAGMREAAEIAEGAVTYVVGEKRDLCDKIAATIRKAKESRDAG